VTADHLAAALRALGLYPLEAGTELLISNATFLHRDDFTSRFIETGTSISDGTTLMAAIDWDVAIAALNAGVLPCSGGKSASSSYQPASQAASPSTSATPSRGSTTATPPSWSPQSGTQPANNPGTEDIETHTDSSQISIFHRAPARNLGERFSRYR
jgi:hypothetical protein